MLNDSDTSTIISEVVLARLTDLFYQFEGAFKPESISAKEAKFEFNSTVNGLWEVARHRCVNPNHLFLGTRLDNMRDCVSKNRQQKGEAHFFSKLNDEDVREIKSLYSDGNFSYSILGGIYGVCWEAVRAIIKRGVWKHVAPLPEAQPDLLADRTSVTKGRTL